MDDSPLSSPICTIYLRISFLSVLYYSRQSFSFESELWLEHCRTLFFFHFFFHFFFTLFYLFQLIFLSHSDTEVSYCIHRIKYTYNRLHRIFDRRHYRKSLFASFSCFPFSFFNIQNFIFFFFQGASR